jgi:hypothetical protein
MLQASPQKINLQGLPPHLALQFGNPAFLNTTVAITRESLCAVLAHFPTPTVQHVGIDLTCPHHLGQ